MKHSLIILMAMAAGAANAQGFAPLSLSDAGDVCYSWSGDTRTSAGSFSRCQPTVYLKPAKPAPPAPVAIAPVSVTPVCPPQIVLEPAPAPAKRKPRPRPMPTCK